MREKFKSFFAGYVFIPIVFYTADMGCQVAFVQGDLPDLLLLTVVLVVLNGLMFWSILTQKRFPIRSPWSLIIGAVIGLWHFLVPYLFIGSYLVWKTAPRDDLSLTMEDFTYFGASLVNPFLNFYQWQCDGSLGAALLSVILFAGIVLKPKLGMMKK